jgi:hypothetical protein
MVVARHPPFSKIKVETKASVSLGRSYHHMCLFIMVYISLSVSAGSYDLGELKQTRIMHLGGIGVSSSR